MSTAQELLDEVRATQGQRWMLALASVIAPALGCVAIGAASGQPSAAVTSLVALLAFGSSLRLDSHVGALVMVAVVWYWLARVDDPATAWSIAVAMSLLVFHTTTALMAVTSRSGVLGREILGPWLWRTVVVAVGTIATWALVVVLDRRHAAGNALLTLGAVVALGGATLVGRARSMPRP